MICNIQRVSARRGITALLDLASAGSCQRALHFCNISIGFGDRAAPLIIDGFYNVSPYRDRSAQNGILNGSYEHIAHAIGLSIGRTF